MRARCWSERVFRVGDYSVFFVQARVRWQLSRVQWRENLCDVGE